MGWSIYNKTVLGTFYLFTFYIIQRHKYQEHKDQLLLQQTSNNIRGFHQKVMKQQPQQYVVAIYNEPHPLLTSDGYLSKYHTLISSNIKRTIMLFLFFVKITQICLFNIFNTISLTKTEVPDKHVVIYLNILIFSYMQL